MTPSSAAIYAILVVDDSNELWWFLLFTFMWRCTIVDKWYEQHYYDCTHSYILIIRAIVQSINVLRSLHNRSHHPESLNRMYVLVNLAWSSSCSMSQRLWSYIRSHHPDKSFRWEIPRMTLTFSCWRFVTPQFPGDRCIHPTNISVGCDISSK